MSHTLSTASVTQLPTIADIRRAMGQMASIPKKTDWALISPDGRMWEGSSDALLAVLAQHHSLLKPIGWVQP